MKQLLIHFMVQTQLSDLFDEHSKLFSSVWDTVGPTPGFIGHFRLPRPYAGLSATYKYLPFYL